MAERPSAQAKWPQAWSISNGSPTASALPSFLGSGPKLKGLKAQADQLKETKARKDTAYATEDAVYRHWDHNLPMNRVPHLLMIDIATGEVTDLLEGSGYELPRR
jgi:hypothetical protein